MRYKYSKSAVDVQLEGANILAQDTELQKTILEVTALLKEYPSRSRCIVCVNELEESEVFQHRDIPFKYCSQCGHVQTFHEVDETYDQAISKSLGYEVIYPELDQEAYNSRCTRIYEPKARWIIESLKESSIIPAELKWCDVGCGAGYFLKSLQNAGCKNIQGLDIDAHNLKIAQDVLGDEIVTQNPYSFGQVFANIHADIYTSFFVLEHITNTSKVIDALNAKPKGTLFAFSVPVFGFITVFESIIKDHYPRCLDAMMHTQIYTEKSLAYFIEESGYEIISEWIFGQDMMDFYRFISSNTAERYPESLRRESMMKFEALIDPIQSAIDLAHFADARHILMVKK